MTSRHDLHDCLMEPERRETPAQRSDSGCTRSESENEQLNLKDYVNLMKVQMRNDLITDFTDPLNRRIDDLTAQYDGLSQRVTQLESRQHVIVDEARRCQDRGETLRTEVYHLKREVASLAQSSRSYGVTEGELQDMNTEELQDHAAKTHDMLVDAVENEFYALGAGCADGLYVRAILSDLGMRAKINLRCDAKAARALAQRQGLSKRTRHVKVKYLYVQDLVRAKEVEVSRVSTETNLADVGTKHLPSHRLEFLKSLMGKSSEIATTFQADSEEQLDEFDGKSTGSQHG